MIRDSLSIYSPQYPQVLAYMLQSTEYQALPYLRWIWRTEDFSGVRQRRQLDKTKAAKLLAAALYAGMATQIVIGIVLIFLGYQGKIIGGVPFGATLLLMYPVVWAHLIIFPLLLARSFVIDPGVKRAIRDTTPVYANHPGIKIAVAGSYGKTSMKELLKTVISEKLIVAATPANKNVSSSHAAFAKSLSGSEDVIIIEYGEGEPGDIARFTTHTSPTHAVITGLAPAHLDKYKTLQTAGQDILSVTKVVVSEHVYINADSPELQPFTKPNYQSFGTSGALGWKVSKIAVNLEGTSFVMKKAKLTLKLQSGLVGEHQVGFLVFVAALALELGLTPKQVEAGIAKTKPFEHRMQPYRLNGAWIVDDTYNGNLEGIRAGTQLLKNIAAARKLYVTPGLVDQGEDTKAVHIEVGKLIALATPDVTVLMKNSVTAFIQEGLRRGKYKGIVRVEDQPLDFYLNLSHQVAKGDLVVMQNDWTDNYA